MKLEKPDLSELKIITDLVVKLTKLKLAKCEHLCIENFSSELLCKLMVHYVASKNGFESLEDLHEYIREVNQCQSVNPKP